MRQHPGSIETSERRHAIHATASAWNTSLSARSPTLTKGHEGPRQTGLKHASGAIKTAKSLQAALQSQSPRHHRLEDRLLNDVRSLPPHAPKLPPRSNRWPRKTAVILMFGASGGVAGPSSVYISVADKIASLRRGLPVLRMDCRLPARDKYCVADVLAAMEYLQTGFAVNRFVLVG